jgi:hypothetical protein
VSERDSIGYIVVTYNQASHQPGLDFPDLHADLESARDEQASKKQETYCLGRRERHVVAEVIELDDPETLVAGEPCEGFRWIGQPITSCDRCGRPAWEHAGEERLRKGAALPFGTGEDPFEIRPWAATVLASWRRRGLIPAATDHNEKLSPS